MLSIPFMGYDVPDGTVVRVVKVLSIPFMGYDPTIASEYAYRIFLSIPFMGYNIVLWYLKSNYAFNSLYGIPFFSD